MEKEGRFDLDLDEDEGPIVGEAVVALVKFLLYQRGQMPDLFDALAASRVGSTSSVTSVAGVRRRLQARRENSFVDTFSELFVHLRSLLDSNVRIRRVVVVLGSTPVTPKETHCIEIPDDRLGAGGGSTHAADTGLRLQAMFRSLMSSWSHAHFPNCPSGSNAYVMLEASATSRMTWFVPKNYSPLRPTSIRAAGRHRFTYRLSSVCRRSRTTPADDRRRPFAVYESPAPLNEMASVDQSHSKPSASTTEETFLWFQMPTVVRGLGPRG